MLYDGYDQYNNDRTDVIVVSRSGSEDEPESEPLANDCRALTLPAHPKPKKSSVVQSCMSLNLTFYSSNSPGHDGTSPSQGSRIRDRS